MNLFRVAIVGAGSLKGKELKEALEERRFPAVEVKLLDDDESLGQLEAVADEATFIQGVRPEQFANVDFAFFAAEEGFTRENWKLAKRAGSAIVDMSYALEELSEAAIRAPWIEQELRLDEQLDLEADAAVVAHPAAVVLALLLLRVQKLGAAKTAVATILEPVSERGRRGMDELHEQTVSLLSFQEMTKKVFDVQVAFNAIARYGQQAHTQLEAVEARILRHFQKVTRDRVSTPATVLVQAPIFHAHIFSIYIELERKASLGDVEQALQGEHVSLIRAGQEDGPSNVTAAGRDEILLSVRRDPQHENGFWLWAAADNLRLSALTAVDCATALALTRSRGPVQ
jgi:aspartate-semialdehyde dehydrogenase